MHVGWARSKVTVVVQKCHGSDEEWKMVNRSKYMMVDDAL